MSNSEEESSYLSSISKKTLKFKEKELEEEFQILRRPKVTNFFKVVAFATFCLFVLWMPFLILAYIHSKNDETGNDKTKKYDEFWMYFMIVILFVPIIEFGLSKYVSKLNKCRFFLSTLCIYIVSATMGSIDPKLGFDYQIYSIFILIILGPVLYYNFIIGFMVNIFFSVAHMLYLVLWSIKVQEPQYFFGDYVALWILLLLSSYSRVYKYFSGLDQNINFSIYGLQNSVQDYKNNYIKNSYIYASEKERKKTYFFQHSIKKQERDWNNLMCLLPNGIVIHSERTKVVKFRNQAILNITNGYREDPSIKFVIKDSRLDSELILSESINEQFTNLLTHIDSIGSEPQVITYKNDLEDRKLEIAKIEHIDFGGEKCTAIIIKDMNIYEELEIEKVKQKYKDMFVLCISHELRTPLNGIVGVAETMEVAEELSPQDTKRCINQIKNSGYVLKHLIDSVQDLSKIEANTFQLNSAQFNPVAKVEKCINCLSTEFKSRNLLIETDFTDKNLPDLLVADDNRYSEILLSLLINSAKFTYQGKIIISLEYEQVNNLLITIIEDTGIGIDPDFFPYMFSLYGKLKLGNLSADSTPVEGVGIGLTVSKEIIERMGGEIYVESTQGEGTKITFSISAYPLDSRDRAPLDKGSSEFSASVIEELLTPMYPIRLSIINNEAMMPEGEELKKEREGEGNKEVLTIYRRKRRVLIVDDNGFNLFTLKLLLAQLEIDTYEAHNGLEAIESMEMNLERIKNGEDNLEFDMIFMDCNMPIMSGYEVIKYEFICIGNKNTEGKNEKRRVQGNSNNSCDCL